MIRHHDSASQGDKRQFPRRPLPIGYSEVHVRRSGKQRFTLAGHAYDISAGGVRIELDRALEDGEEIDIRVSLPGQRQQEIQAHGSVVRQIDADDVGPARFAVNFLEMASPADRLLIDSYVRSSMEPAQQVA